jgi:hypothetical protein
MLRRSDMPLEKFGLRAWYSIAALAEFANVSRFELRRALLRASVQFVRAGRAMFVPLSEVKKKIPNLFESICVLEERRRKAEQGNPVPPRAPGQRFK